MASASIDLARPPAAVGSHFDTDPLCSTCGHRIARSERERPERRECECDGERLARPAVDP